jgi:hypothetical protein
LRHDFLTCHRPDRRLPEAAEKLLIRKTGLEYLIDIHVEVDPESSVREGHTIGHAVKFHLRIQIITVRDVLVHIEPAPDGTPFCLDESRMTAVEEERRNR